VGRVEEYRTRLRGLAEWEPYLLKESRLPGPRGNLELAQAVAEEGSRELFERCARLAAEQAPVNSRYEFLAFCGVVGLGRLLAEGDRGRLSELRRHASDPRWRLREGVAMALQRLGDADMDGLLAAMRRWTSGPPLVQRAAVAALCEPRLLKEPRRARAVLSILDRVTASLQRRKDRRSAEFLTLRQALGYCWSVAVAALPDEGKARMEKWLPSKDRDVRWIMKENLKKKRLLRADPGWVETWRKRLED
jgi:hypothetical protein